MTGRPDPDRQHITEELHSEFVAALGETLDEAAGLREILLHSRHEALVRELGDVLDPEGGLAAILPPAEAGADPAPGLAPGGIPAAHDGDPAGQRFLESVSPQARLRLRTEPAVREAWRVRVFTSAQTRFLAHMAETAAELSRCLDGDPPGTPAETFARASRLVSSLAENLQFMHGPGFDLAAEFEMVCGFPPPPTGADGGDGAPQAWAETLAQTRRHALELSRHLITRIQRDNAESWQGLVTALARSLGKRIPMIDDTAVAALLNDFTRADLHDAVLVGMDLGEVRWSEDGTRWPDDVDLEELRNRSVETPPGSGIHVIRRGGLALRPGRTGGWR